MSERTSTSSNSTIILAMASYKIMNANRCILQEPEEALRIYTSVASSGHPVALVNRSLCYLLLNRPELAAMDAERAYRLSFDTRTGAEGGMISAQLDDYATCCYKAGSAPWVASSKHILTGLEMPLRLTELAITNTPYTAVKARSGSTPNAFHDLRVKALFRLAYALWKCGGGAQRSALTVLDRAKNVSRGIGLEEREWLGTKIMVDLQRQFYSLHDTAGNVTSLKALLASRYALVQSETGEPRGRDHQAENDAILQLDPSAEVAFALQDGRNELTAFRDIFAGDVLFTDSTSLSVSTASMEDLATQHYCEACSALMDIRNDTLDRLVDHSGDNVHMRTPIIPSPSTSGELVDLHDDMYMDSSSTPSPQAEESLTDDGYQICRTRSHPDSSMNMAGQASDGKKNEKESISAESDATESACNPPPLPPPPHAIYSISQQLAIDAKVCQCCTNRSCWCSHECEHNARRSHHFLLCDSRMEEFLRRTFDPSHRPDSLDPRDRFLTMLLLCRLMSWAQNTGKHPLDLPAIRLLRAAALASRNNAAELAWSYDTNIVSPLAILYVLEGCEGDLAFDIEKWDGQTINTIIHTIQCHIHVSKQSWRHIFDENGKVAASGLRCDGDDELLHNENHEDSEMPSQIRFGRLRPLCGLVGIASNGSQPNVELVDLGDNRIICVPLRAAESGLAGSALPLISAGEPLFLASLSIRDGTEEERRMYQRSTDSSSSSADLQENINDTLMAYQLADDDYEMAADSDDSYHDDKGKRNQYDG